MDGFSVASSHVIYLEEDTVDVDSLNGSSVKVYLVNIKNKNNADDYQISFMLDKNKKPKTTRRKSKRI